MEIILNEDIQGLGYKNDLVTVKAGYGRNYLVPKGLAMVATPSNKKMIEENQRQAAHKAQKIKDDAEAIAKKMSTLNLEISTKVENGKIFGAITTLQVTDALEAKGIKLDRKQIQFKEKIKEVGEHIITVDLHKEVKPEITIHITPEE